MAAKDYLRYRPEVEEIDPDEGETFDRIVAVMRKGGAIVREREGRALRTSHAKAHGLLVGELQVLDGLPAPLRQGVFATPRRYPVLVRLAHVPGELLDDSRVSCPRGLAIKIIGVEGEMLPQHAGEITQDWVLDTGKVFNNRAAKPFLAGIAMTETSTPMPTGVKQTVSAVSRASNKALNAVGLNSANLDFYGHPWNHPLGEAYYSQAPIRYGEHIAKLRFAPARPAMRALAEQQLEPEGENGLRSATVDFFRDNDVEFEVAVQLCTDLERMPVEDANKEWPEDESPYQPVARLLLPRQDAFAAERAAQLEALSFAPAHSLEAHKPLGSIMRARMHAYEVLGRERRAANGMAQSEPRSIEPFRQAGQGGHGEAQGAAGREGRAATAGAVAASHAASGARPLAVVTGASTGIGYELARCCAQHGFDLLIAADEAEIDAAAERLRTASGVNVEAVQADLATPQGVSRLHEALRGRPVDALLANAGRGLGRAFIEQDFAAVRHVVDTNVTGTLDLLHRVGREMRARGRGRILIVGSTAGFMPGSYQAAYNASKAFLDSFSFGLRNELKESGVTVTCLMPGPTDTEFFRRAGLLDTKVGQQAKDDPAMVARAGFEAMMAGEGEVVSGLKNKLQALFAHVTPAALLAGQHRRMAQPGTARH